MGDIRDAIYQETDRPFEPSGESIIRKERERVRKMNQDKELAVFRERLDKTCSEIISLLMSKRQSYGPDNLTRDGGVGIIVRTSDKLERLRTFYRLSNDVMGDGEGARDAWRDIIGYGLLGLMHFDDNGIE